MTEESTVVGSSGWVNIINRHEAITETNKLHAAIADEVTSQLTDFLGEVNTTIVTSMVVETPPRKAHTKASCSATATI